MGVGCRRIRYRGMRLEGWGGGTQPTAYEVPLL